MSVKDFMKELGIEVTRESYINVAWADQIPDPWTAEEEGMLPEELQDWDLFELVNGELVLKEGAYPSGEGWTEEEIEEREAEEYQPPTEEE